MQPVSIVGILNVTPDSYVDGGLYTDVANAVERVGQMLAEGADIIDIGGQSTGPGSKDVPVDEELQRTIPVIEAILKKYPDTFVSIDTFRSQVAEEALKRGVRMVNDVTAGRSDQNIFSVSALYKAEIVLMYAKDSSPRTTVQETEYRDVIGEIHAFLESRVAIAVAAGIPRERIIVDPGLGHFVSSSSQYSFEVLRRLGEFSDLGRIYVSPSRKSFLAGPENLPVSERLPATIAASAIAVMNGASFIRTHDVAAVRQGCEVAMASH
ncbi:dihydropteroate synthase [Candidatus Peregrinibacteria bacterium]|nr:dihydropteroate synthase [Candidatus Peregrinibacteria bacterium]